MSKEELATVGGLLAIIFRDGGHYFYENGLDKSCYDAQNRIQAMRISLASIMHAIDSIKDDEL